MDTRTSVHQKMCKTVHRRTKNSNQNPEIAQMPIMGRMDHCGVFAQLYTMQHENELHPHCNNVHEYHRCKLSESSQSQKRATS